MFASCSNKNSSFNLEILLNNSVLCKEVPQASSFCQPVRLEFRKETPEVSREINGWIDAAAEEMKKNPHFIEVNGKKVKFVHTIKKTMMDTKVKNAVTDTASAVKTTKAILSLRCGCRKDGSA